ncbi:ABC transporter family substrate-binding protein [Allonocardiopsis opalescens]|uniref:ABC transporter family substrate-binding protein n=1 Tax=Allonocardiopsis opalescens TaxID=1144618 RepID=UPI001FE3E690|nr:ABC transporter family substrate-binding protein [Allonocardiopsis opalescens]
MDIGRAGLTRLRWLACAAVLALTASCAASTGEPEPGQAADLPASDTNPVPRDELAPGGELLWALSMLPSQWNPHHIDGNTQQVETVMGALMPSAYRTDELGNAEPDPDYVLAADLDLDQGQTLTLTLNPQARWSDGSPITWRDYAGQAEALSGEDGDYRIAGSTGYDRIASVERGVDDFQAVVTFREPYAEYAQLFSPLLPLAYTEDPDAFNTGYAEDIPVTAGPFEPAGTDPGVQSLTVRRDPDWWGEPALLNSIVFRAVPTDAQVAGLANGELDVVQLPAGPSAYRQALALDEVTVRRAIAPDIRHVTLNGGGPILSDQRVRHAVFAAIDRTVLAESALEGLDWPVAVQQNRFLLPSQPGYQDTSNGLGDYDTARAERLLEEAGWELPPGADQRSDGASATRVRDGEELVLRMPLPQGFGTARAEGELIRYMLAQVGIEVDLEEVPGETLFSDYVIPGNFDLVAFSNVGSAFPISESRAQWMDAVPGDDGEPQWRNNVGRIGSAEIDAALAAAVAETDQERAREQLNTADRLLWEAGHTLPLYQRPEFVAVPSALANLGAEGLLSIDYADIGFMR